MLVLLKFSVYLFSGSLVVVTRQLAFGAVVVHEKAIRPVPVSLATFTVVEFPLVAPAFNVRFPLAVSVGAGIADGVY